MVPKKWNKIRPKKYPNDVVSFLFSVLNFWIFEMHYFKFPFKLRANVKKRGMFSKTNKSCVTNK